ncbi:MAG: hypothetical protein ACR2KK_09285 [Acidimicrobiales bacterium]
MTTRPSLSTDGDILVAEQGLGGAVAGRVVRIHRVSGARTAGSSGGAFVSPIGIAVEAGGTIVVADANAFGTPDDLVKDGGVIRVDSVTGTQTKVSSGGGFVSLRGIAVEAGGGILVTLTAVLNEDLPEITLDEFVETWDLSVWE